MQLIPSRQKGVECMYNTFPFSLVQPQYIPYYNVVIPFSFPVSRYCPDIYIYIPLFPLSFLGGLSCLAAPWDSTLELPCFVALSWFRCTRTSKRHGNRACGYRCLLLILLKALHAPNSTRLPTNLRLQKAGAGWRL